MCIRDSDRDGDGVPDVGDKCPAEPEDKDGFEDDDGCDEPDNDKDGDARRLNLLEAFAVPRPARVAGRRVLLVDDVVATGATMAAAAIALTTSGAAGVVGFAFARAER